MRKKHELSLAQANKLIADLRMASFNDDMALVKNLLSYADCEGTHCWAIWKNHKHDKKCCLCGVLR